MKVGWIGTGVMGGSMCRRLMNAGHSLYLWTRTQSKASELIAAGAKWCDNAGAVTQSADVICTMVGYPTDVRSIYFDPDAIIANTDNSKVLVDFTTSEPRLAQEIYEAATSRGATSLDAPVSGGDIGARNGTLSIMVGGDETTFQRLTDLWSALGKTVVLQGGPGAGQQTKLTNQILVAGNMIGVCEALLYARQAGLDLEKVLQSVSSGAAGSWALTNLGPRIVNQDFAPGFYVEHFVKDLGITLRDCQRLNLQLPGVELAEHLYAMLRDDGGGREGTQAIIKTIAKRSNTSW